MERRKKGSGTVEALECRECGETTVLDPRRMNRDGTGVHLRCHACGAEFNVRIADTFRRPPEGPPMEAPAPEKKKRWAFGRR